MRWLDSITNSVDMHLSKLWEIVKDRDAFCAAIHGVTKSRTRLGNCTTQPRETPQKKLDWGFPFGRKNMSH